MAELMEKLRIELRFELNTKLLSEPQAGLTSWLKADVMVDVKLELVVEQMKHSLNF